MTDRSDAQRERDLELADDLHAAAEAIDAGEYDDAYGIVLDVQANLSALADNDYFKRGGDP